MSYKGDQCGTGLCVTPAPTACGTVRHVHEVHTYEVVPRKTRKRLPWMQPWSANCVPYRAGSLVIHCNEYWYNLCESYSPPGGNGDWFVFDPEEFFRWFHENARGGCNTLAIPVYAREIGCAARDEDPYCAGNNYKLWAKGEVAAGADGKVYVNLVDNNATYPPNLGWSQGRYLLDLIGELVVKGVASSNGGGTPTPTPSPTPSPTPTPGTSFTFAPFVSTQTIDVFLENWWTGLLGRSSDAAGKAFWRAQFMAATTATQFAGVANGFVAAARDPNDHGSPGMPADALLLDAMSESRFVQGLYNAFLGKNGDIPGVQYWADAGRNLGRTAMVYAFLTNGEFAAHAATVKGNG